MDINKDTFVVTVSGKIDRKDDYEWWDAEIDGHSLDRLLDHNDVYCSITIIKKRKCWVCKLRGKCKVDTEEDFCDKWDFDKEAL